MTATITHASALARFGHAVADPTRAQILLALRDEPAFPSDLAEQLGVTRQVMSNQLACLRGCGLVEGESQGRKTLYRLTDDHIASALTELLSVVLVVEPSCCDSEGCAC